MDAYSKLPRVYGIENITTEEVVDKLDIFQSIFGKVDKFGCWVFIGLMADSANTKVSPEISKELVEIWFRIFSCSGFLGRYTVFQKYVELAKKKGVGSYDMTYFYKWQAEMKLKDIRKENGLCPRCVKYSPPKRGRLRKAVQLILVKYDARRQTCITEIDEYGIHLKRGGQFYH